MDYPSKKLHYLFQPYGAVSSAISRIPKDVLEEFKINFSSEFNFEALVKGSFLPPVECREVLSSDIQRVESIRRSLELLFHTSIRNIVLGIEYKSNYLIDKVDEISWGFSRYRYLRDVIFKINTVPGTNVKSLYVCLNDSYDIGALYASLVCFLLDRWATLGPILSNKRASSVAAMNEVIGRVLGTSRYYFLNDELEHEDVAWYTSLALYLLNTGLLTFTENFPGGGIADYTNILVLNGNVPINTLDRFEKLFTIQGKQVVKGHPPVEYLKYMSGRIILPETNADTSAPEQVIIPTCVFCGATNCYGSCEVSYCYEDEYEDEDLL